MLSKGIRHTNGWNGKGGRLKEQISFGSSRGERTAITLFIAGVRGWDVALQGKTDSSLLHRGR